MSQSDDKATNKRAPWWLPLLLLVLPGVLLALGMSLRGSLGAREGGRAGPHANEKSVPSAALVVPAPVPSNFGTTSDDEARALERIEALLEREPVRALALLDEERRHHPVSALAARRDYAEVRALVLAGQIGKARDHASAFYQRYPASPFVERVHALTGQHLPPRMGPDR